MTVVTIVLSIACFIVGGFASYLFFKHGLKNKYDGILRDAEAEAEVIKKKKLRLWIPLMSGKQMSGLQILRMC